MTATIIPFNLPEPLFRAARDVAADRDMSLHDLIRNLLSDEVARTDRIHRPLRASEGLSGVLRARLARDFAVARDWWDLIRRLRDHGVQLREAGGGLALCRAQGGARLCTASDMGWSVNQLARRFGKPFPGPSGFTVITSAHGDEDADCAEKDAI